MIIGLTGKKQSGKSTIAELLVDSFDFECIAFADTLRDICGALYPEIDFWDDTLKESPQGKLQLTPRHILQKVGTDIFRKHFHEDIWVDIVRYKLDNWLEEGQDVVIPDVRFDNEARMIKEYNGYIWKVERISLESIDNHISEQGISLPPDCVIVNNGTIDDLYSLIIGQIGYDIS